VIEYDDLAGKDREDVELLLDQIVSVA